MSAAHATITVNLTGAELLAAIRDGVRATGQTATPYRVGLAAGLAGVTLANPYTISSRGWQCFADGVEVGKLLAERRRAA